MTQEIKVTEYIQDSEEVKQRVNELKEMKGEMVFYNNEQYTVEEIASDIGIIDINKLSSDLAFENRAGVVLRPLKRIVVKGDDILKIKNSVIAIKHTKEGFELTKIVDEGQPRDERGLVHLD